MKIATHYNVAHIAVNRLRNSMADRLKYGLRAKCFCIGAVLPDMSPNLLIHRHFYALSGRYIEKKIKKMAKKGRSGCLQALRAGSIAHFFERFLLQRSRHGRHRQCERSCAVRTENAALCQGQARNFFGGPRTAGKKPGSERQNLRPGQ